MTITGRMHTFLSERIHVDIDEIANDIARRAYTQTRLEEVDEVAARLACWIAVEADAYVNIDDEDDWPLIALIAELAAMTMLAQCRAEVLP